MEVCCSVCGVRFLLTAKQEAHLAQGHRVYCTEAHRAEANRQRARTWQRAYWVRTGQWHGAASRRAPVPYASLRHDV